MQGTDIRKLIERVNLLIDRFEALRGEHEALKEENLCLTTDKQELLRSINAMGKELNSIKLGKQIQLNIKGETERSVLREELQGYIRDVEKCIGILSN